jgi:hypothetical protein
VSKPLEYPANRYYEQGSSEERERIINLLINLNAIRRDVFGRLVAMDTNGEKCIYLTNLEGENK